MFINILATLTCILLLIITINLCIIAGAVLSGVDELRLLRRLCESVNRKIWETKQ